MHFHWQNLNDKPGKRKGSIRRHGRAWLRFGDGHGHRGAGLNWEWGFGTARCALSIGFTDREEVGVRGSICVPLFFSFYFTAYGGPFAWLARKLMPSRVIPAHTYVGMDGPYTIGPTTVQESREISIRIFDWAIWWDIWRDPMGGWSRDVPRWRDGSWHPLDTFFGRHKYARRELSTTQAQVAMPEGAYPCTVKLTEDSWKRPLLPWRRRLLRAHVEMQKSVPHPGKGENSWDCGEDATSAMTCCAATVEEAIARMTESVLNSRRRHGGSVNWVPSADRKVEA